MVPDLYGPVHKAVRLALAELVAEVGGCDPARPADWSRVEGAWQRMAFLLDAHGFHEDLHIRPLIVIAAPEVASVIDVQHTALDRGTGEIGDKFAAMRDFDSAAARRRAARDIYRTLSLFIADYHRHLTEEASRALPALADRFPPVTLFMAQRALCASLDGEMALSGRPRPADCLSSPVTPPPVSAPCDAAAPTFFAVACRVLRTAATRRHWPAGAKARLTSEP